MNQLTKVGFSKTRLQWAIKCTVIFTVLFSSFNTLAKSSDENAPLHIEANQLEIHEKNDFSIYNGDVIITKGSLKITGDKIIIKNKDGKLHSVHINGSPATFFQLNDLDEAITAESNMMDYQAQSGILELKDNAKLIKNKNHFSSEHIIYNTLKDIVKAGGQYSSSSQKSTAGKSASEKSPRVRITIYPEDKPANKPTDKQ